MKKIIALLITLALIYSGFSQGGSRLDLTDSVGSVTTPLAGVSNESYMWLISETAPSPKSRRMSLFQLENYFTTNGLLGPSNLQNNGLSVENIVGATGSFTWESVVLDGSQISGTTFTGVTPTFSSTGGAWTASSSANMVMTAATGMTFTSTNNDVTFSLPSGDFITDPTTGDVILQGLTYPSSDGTSGQVISTDGLGNLSFTTVGGGGSFPLQGPDGTAAAPSYSFTNSTNSGLYLISAGNLGFTTGGTLRATLGSSGNWDYDGADLNDISEIHTADENATSPAYSFTNNTNLGMYRSGTNELSFAASGVQRLAVGVNGIIGYLPIYIEESATASASSAGLGQLWVENTSPNHLHFTDDAGNDYNLSDQFGGGFYVSTAAETSISTVNTPVKAAGTTTTTQLDNFDTNSLDNRLRYTGSITRSFQVVCSVSMTTASNNKVTAIYIAKNGSVETASEIQRLVGTGSDVGALATSTYLTLATNDYVELWVENQTDATNMTVEKCNCSVH